MSAGVGVGAGASGVITDLVAKGALDVWLTKGATQTYWRASYQKHTNFSMETVRQRLDTGAPNWAQTETGTVQINRTGDLLYFLYAHITLPGIKYSSTDGGSDGWKLDKGRNMADDTNLIVDKKDKDGNVVETHPACGPCDGEGDTGISVEMSDDRVEEELCSHAWAHWSNAVGQMLFDRIDLKIGGQTVDHIWGEFMYCFEECAGKVGRRLLEMIGKRYDRTSLIAASQQQQELYVPLPFWFTQASGNALPLSSLQFHSVRLEMHMRPLKNLVVWHDPNTGSDGYVKRCPNTVGPTVAVMGTFVYLGNAERDLFASSNYEILMIQHQLRRYNVTTPNAALTLQFNHPVIELMWTVQRQKFSEKAGLFNYAGVRGKDPLEHALLQLNSQPRFGGSDIPGNYYRLVQPYQAHSCIPDSFVYVWSFSLFPEDACSPSGSINMSRIDSVILNLDLDSDLFDASLNEVITVTVMATNWQLGRLRDGLFGVAYSS